MFITMYRLSCWNLSDPARGVTTYSKCSPMLSVIVMNLDIDLLPLGELLALYTGIGTGSLYVGSLFFLYE